MALNGGAVPNPAPKVVEEFFKPCDMCGIFTTIRIRIGKKTSALCIPHTQSAIAHLSRRGLHTITFSK